MHIEIPVYIYLINLLVYRLEIPSSYMKSIPSSWELNKAIIFNIWVIVDYYMSCHEYVWHVHQLAYPSASMNISQLGAANQIIAAIITDMFHN